jgi:hypothetical protein
VITAVMCQLYSNMLQPKFVLHAQSLAPASHAHHCAVSMHKQQLVGCHGSYCLLLLLCSYTTGLQYKDKGLGSPPDATRRNYRTGRQRKNVLVTWGAGVNFTQIARAACGKDDILDRVCVLMCCCWR